MSEDNNPNSGDNEPRDEGEKPSNPAPPPRRPAPVDYYEGSENSDYEQTIDLSASERKNRD